MTTAALDLTEMQTTVRDSAREFAEKRLKPTAMKFDALTPTQVVDVREVVGSSAR